MPTEMTKPDGPIAGFVHRHKMNFFAGLGLAGNVLIAVRGGFDHDDNMRWGGYDMMAGAASGALGGPKLLTASGLAAGGVENLVSAVHNLQATSLSLDSGLKLGFAAVWTVAPFAMYCGTEIVESLQAARPTARLMKLLSHARNSIPANRLLGKLVAADHEQVGAGLYNAAAVTVGIEGMVAMAKAVAQHSTHSMKEAAIGIATSAVFIVGNSIAAMRPAPALPAPRKTRAATLRLFEI